MGIPPGAENKGDGVDILKVSGQPDLAKPHAIVVDPAGVRYMNEGGSYVETCQIMRDRHRKAPAIPSWLIVDQQYMRKYMLCGTIPRSEEHTSELQSLMRISYAVFCLKKKKKQHIKQKKNKTNTKIT